MKKILTLMLSLLVLLLPALALSETVTASFFPIYLFASNLLEGTEGIELHSLAQPQTGCLHDYQLSSGDLKALSNSDVFLINGAGMEGFMSFVFEAFPDLPLIDASTGIDLLPSESGETEYNAHIWLTPANASRMVQNLSDGLCASFPKAADTISANCSAYIQRLDALDKELRDGLSSLSRRDLLTFHEAFPYFAKAYDLEIVAVIALEPEDPLSPAQLGHLVTLIRDHDLPPLFTEPQYPSLAADTLSRETGAPVSELNPCVTAPDGTVPLDWYEQIMRGNLAVLREALGAQ